VLELDGWVEREIIEETVVFRDEFPTPGFGLGDVCWEHLGGAAADEQRSGEGVAVEHVEEVPEAAAGLVLARYGQCGSSINEGSALQAATREEYLEEGTRQSRDESLGLPL
jgi:hypothetical protein